MMYSIGLQMGPQHGCGTVASYNSAPTSVHPKTTCIMSPISTHASTRQGLSSRYWIIPHFGDPKDGRDYVLGPKDAIGVCRYF